jgi:hypothetical protein
MGKPFDRRQDWHRIVGLERRGAPLATLMGRPLPDPTLLIDEDFLECQDLAARRTPHAAVPADEGGKR